MNLYARFDWIVAMNESSLMIGWCGSIKGCRHVEMAEHRMVTVT